MATKQSYGDTKPMTKTEIKEQHEARNESRCKADAVEQEKRLVQFQEMKVKHPDAILLFRVGDFYEAYSDDAVECAEILNITLTMRKLEGKEDLELCGFPHHALDMYLPKIIRSGKRVAICEQLIKP